MYILRGGAMTVHCLLVRLLNGIQLIEYGSKVDRYVKYEINVSKIET